MSRNPIELFVEAFPAAAAQALSGKTSAAWAITVDEKPKPFPPATELLTMILVAEPSQAEAAIQITVENAHSLAALLGAAAPVSGEIQHGYEQAVRAVLGEASEKAAAVLEGAKVHLRVARAQAGLQPESSRLREPMRRRPTSSCSYCSPPTGHRLSPTPAWLRK